MQPIINCCVFNSKEDLKTIVMKTHTHLILLVLIAFILNSCSLSAIKVDEDDPVSYKNIDFSDYNSIEISDDFKAYVRFSDTEENIQLEANDKLYKNILVTKKNNTLKIERKNSINIFGSPILNVYITTKSIEHFKATSDAVIYLEDELITDVASIKIASDGRFYGKVDVGNLDFYSASDAKAEITGYVNELNARLSSDSRISDYDLEIADLKIKLSSDSKANLTVTNSLDVIAESDAALYYKGDPDIIKKTIRSDAKVIKVD